MKNLTFKGKILFYTTLVFFSILIIIVSYNAISRYKSEKAAASVNAVLHIENFSNYIKNKIDKAFITLNTLNDNTIPALNKLDRITYNKILMQVLKNNPEFLTTWTVWEPNSFDNKDKDFVNKVGYDQTGRLICCWSRKNTNEFTVEACKDYEVEGAGDYYLKPKKNKIECVMDPYFYSYEALGGKPILITSVVCPIIINGEFKGVVGHDYSISFIQSLTLGIQSKIYNGQSSIEILSNSGILVASTITPDSVGHSITEIDSEQADDLMKKIQKGKSENKYIGDNLIITKSFSFGLTNKAWLVKFTIPVSEITKKSREVVLYSILSGLILLFLGLLFLFLMVRRLTKPLDQLVLQSNRIAEGDLTGQIDYESHDEIGQLAQSFDKMIFKLREIIEAVSEGANNVVVSTTQIASTASQLAQGANQQASAAEEISASIEEMTASIQQNSENSAQTELISKNAVEGIVSVNSASSKSVTAIKDIAARVTIINDIAEKTDILAINAAIEAARAGEHGKGFAVVAAEVRKLAEITQKAAKEINDLSRFNLNLTEEASKLMDSVIPNIKKTAQLLQEITAASNEQSSGTAQIANAIELLSQVTQENSAAAEEMSTGSEELMSQAEILKEVISFFKTGNIIKTKNDQMKAYIKQQTHIKVKNKSVYLDMNDTRKMDDNYERI